MKATAAVPPFLNFNMRNHPQEHHLPLPMPPASSSSAEGGFAAALRKLAQQAPGGFPAPILPRASIHSPPGKQIKGTEISSNYESDNTLVYFMFIC